MTEALIHLEDGSYNLTTKQAIYHISATDVINTIGKGAFGVVFKATCGNSVVAIKQLSKGGNDMERVRQEVQIMATLKECFNIVKLIDLTEDSQFFYIIMDYYDKGSLTSVINKDMLKSEKEIIEMFRQICYGMHMMHQRKMVHRDIKTDNILVQSYNDTSYSYHLYMAIADFGLSRASIETKMTLNIGTETTKAPEVSTGIYDRKVDIYSLGCILYKMLSKADPFKGSTIEAIKEEKKREKLLVGKGPFSRFTMNLLEGCLQYDKNSRISSEELIDILQIESLYTNYKDIELGSLDADQYICLKERRRKINEQKKKDEEEALLAKQKAEQVAKESLKEEMKGMIALQIKEELNTTVKPLSEENTKLKEELSKLKTENENYKDRISNISSILDEAKLKIEENKSNMINLKEFIETANNNLTQFKEKEYKLLKTELDNYKVQQEINGTSLTEVKSSLVEHTLSLAQLKTESAEATKAIATQIKEAVKEEIKNSVPIKNEEVIKDPAVVAISQKEELINIVAKVKQEIANEQNTKITKMKEDIEKLIEIKVTQINKNLEEQVNAIKKQLPDEILLFTKDKENALNGKLTELNSLINKTQASLGEAIQSIKTKMETLQADLSNESIINLIEKNPNSQIKEALVECQNKIKELGDVNLQHNKKIENDYKGIDADFKMMRENINFLKTEIERIILPSNISKVQTENIQVTPTTEVSPTGNNITQTECGALVKNAKDWLDKLIQNSNNDCKVYTDKAILPLQNAITQSNPNSRENKSDVVSNNVIQQTSESIPQSNQNIPRITIGNLGANTESKKQENMIGPFIPLEKSATQQIELNLNAGSTDTQSQVNNTNKDKPKDNNPQGTKPKAANTKVANTKVDNTKKTKPKEAKPKEVAKPKVAKPKEAKPMHSDTRYTNQLTKTNAGKPKK